jgi:hypothetical protein
MFRPFVFVFAILAAFLAGSPFRVVRAAQDGQKQGNERSAPPAKATVSSLTGCVDEQEGNYVLLSDRTMNPIANLEPDGFPKEGFAKHVGHKVTVRGTSSAQEPLPLMKVRSIETVAESCTPQG